MPLSLRLFLAVWTAILGGCVGSFLNVVIYRLPRRMSLLQPGSHCPNCRRPIRWVHNIPVVSWLVLSGRCHDCRAAISMRYPVVEAVTAAMFAAVAWTGPLAGGENPPAALSAGPAGLPVVGWELCAYYLVLLCFLLALALMEFDGDLPADVGTLWRVYAGFILVGLLAPLAMSVVSPVPGGTPPTLLAHWAGSNIRGAGAAILLAIAARPATGLGPMRERGRWFAAGNLLLVGTFLGPAAVFVLAATTAGVYLAVTCVARFAPPRSRPTWSTILLVLTLGWLVGRVPWVGWQPHWPPWETALAAAGLLLATGLLSLGTWANAR